MSRASTTLLALIVYLAIHCSYGNYTVTIDLKTYQNPTHMRAQSNDCCDGDCSDPCDNRFRFCYTDSENIAEIAGVLRVWPEEAVVGCQFASRLVAANNDNITFPKWGIFGETVDNPLKIPGDIWPGLGFLLVIVFDVDEYTLDDTVDAIIIPIHPSSLRQYTSIDSFNGEYEFGTLTARYRVDCDDDFYGSDCSVLCMERDDVDGHYECNHNGNRVCLEGYQNTSSDCTQCVPSIGCSPVGGYCSLPGNCVCLPGFTGTNCSEAIIQEGPQQCDSPTSDSSESDDTIAAVYTLGVLVGILLLLLITVSVVVIVLIMYHRKKDKVRPVDERSSRGYYMNEGMGPDQPTTINTLASQDNETQNLDAVSERSSRQYATVDSNQRQADNFNSFNPLDRSTSSTALTVTSPTDNNDVPDSSLRPNVAYGLEQKRKRAAGVGGGYINGVRMPMRPPPRPPR